MPRLRGGSPDLRRDNTQDTELSPSRARPGCSNHRGTLQVQVVARPGHHAYGVTKSVNLVHEIFLHLHSYFPEYLWEHYDVAQD